MNLIDLIKNSTLGRRLFAEDLADRANDRKKLIANIENLKKELGTVSNKPILKIDAEIKAAEAQIVALREKRYELITANNQERESLTKQLKAAELALKQQAPAVLIGVQTVIHEKLRKKSFMQADQFALVDEMLTELGSLLYCLDDAKVLDRAMAIEAAASRL